MCVRVHSQSSQALPKAQHSSVRRFAFSTRRPQGSWQCSPRSTQLTAAHRNILPALPSFLLTTSSLTVSIGAYVFRSAFLVLTLVRSFTGSIFSAFPARLWAH